MCECLDTTECIYDSKVGELELLLVEHRVLPNQLASYHGHIMVNIEVVNFDDENEYRKGVRMLKDIYHKLSTRPEYDDFHNRLIYHDDVDEIEIIG
ncbi:Uncharacterised protein [[Clostridium] sordellii]|nr:Uncharacterised protein [[Clostridium] sordellii] [Paeniclostridium sordellii]